MSVQLFSYHRQDQVDLFPMISNIEVFLIRCTESFRLCVRIQSNALCFFLLIDFWFRLLYIILYTLYCLSFYQGLISDNFHASYNVTLTIIKFSMLQTIIQQSKHMTQQQDPFYKQTWDSLSPTPNQEYLNESITIQWVNRILAQRDQHHKLASVNVQQQLHIFMKHIHSLDRATMKEVMFKFEEAMQFYEWLLQKYGQEVQLQGKDQGVQGEDSNNKQDQNNIDKMQNQQKKGQQNKQKQIQKIAEQQQNFLYPSKQKQSPAQQNQFQEQTQKFQQDEQQQQQLTNNYRDYLLTIFQHYCRMSYATGNDPTFQQIQQKTQVMTINKFMIFCKDFGIVKLNGITRQGLVEIFKKNSEFYKEMNYQQFVTVLVRVAKIVYGAEADEEPKETSKEFQQFLLFLQVNNFSAFKKKIQSLNISYKGKAVTQNMPKKPTLQNYKFKYTSNNGKSEQQVRQQLEERKRIRSENKLKLIEKRPNKNMSSKKDIVKAQHQQRDLMDRAQIKTTQPTRKQLIPPIPPPRKPTNNINRQPAEPVVTGYANIHRLKVLGKQGQADSKMRLNSVVEEAKKMLQLDRGQQNYEYPVSNRVSTYGHETPYSNYSQNRKHSNYQQFDERGMAQSEHSNYSQRDLHHVLDESPVKRRNYAAHGHSQLQKRQAEKGQNTELKGLINNDSEQDQFLEEHLNREKKIGHINERIEKKIKEYQIKNFN